VIAAQATNCSRLDFAPVIKSSKASQEAAAGMKKVCDRVKPLQRALGAICPRILRVMAKAPLDVQVAFFNGYNRALQKRMYCGRSPIFFETTATRLYVILVLLAPKMHHVKSVAMLHRILCKALGDRVVGDIKRLEKLCQRIGLTFRKAGRPPKSCD
jgi:RNA-binding protein YlmH